MCIFLYQTSVVSQGPTFRQAMSFEQMGARAGSKGLYRVYLLKVDSLRGISQHVPPSVQEGTALLIKLWSRFTVQRQNQPFMAMWPRRQSVTLAHICTKYEDTLSLVKRTLLTFLIIHPVSQFLDRMYYFAVIFQLKSNNKNKLERSVVSWTVFTLTVF